MILLIGAFYGGSTCGLSLTRIFGPHLLKVFECLAIYMLEYLQFPMDGFPVSTTNILFGLCPL